MSKILIDSFFRLVVSGMGTEFIKLTFITRCNRAFKADL